MTRQAVVSTNMVYVSTDALRSLFEPCPPLSPVVCRLTQGEVSSVLEQLEQDRVVASKRARRLQEDLYRTQQVRHPTSVPTLLSFAHFVPCFSVLILPRCH